MDINLDVNHLGFNITKTTNAVFLQNFAPPMPNLTNNDQYGVTTWWLWFNRHHTHTANVTPALLESGNVLGEVGLS